MKGLTDVSGILLGHWTHAEAVTGCTVVLCPQGAAAGVDVRGSSPGTRETDLLDPICSIPVVHGLVLAGGSAYGLSAADGVMHWLEERGHGFRVRQSVVPIVPAAVLFDLAIGRSDVRPAAASGYAACEAAGEGSFDRGCVGAGTGASAGKLLGPQRATKSGLGTSSRKLPDGLIVAAMAAANPFGDVVDPELNTILAGARLDEGGFADTMRLVRQQSSLRLGGPGANTTLAVVATNARLTKTEATKVAQMAQDGLARVLRPAHTEWDGDTVFTLSLGDQRADVSRLGAVAAEVVAEAILDGVRMATPMGGLPCTRDLAGKTDRGQRP